MPCEFGVLLLYQAWHSSIRDLQPPERRIIPHTGILRHRRRIKDGLTNDVICCKMVVIRNEVIFVRKVFALLTVVCLVFSGCGEKEDKNEQNAKSKNENIVSVSINDPQHTISTNSVYNIDVMNNSSNYVTGIVKVKAFDDGNNEIKNEFVFLNNLGPKNTEIGSLLIPIGKNAHFDYEIIRINESKEPMVTPDIDDSNLYEYIYMTVEDHNQIHTNGKKLIDVNIHNLTTNNAKLDISIVIKDKDGKVIGSKKVIGDTFPAYYSQPYAFFIEPDTEYTVEYTVEKYVFAK